LKWTERGFEEVLLQRIHSSFAFTRVHSELFPFPISTVHFADLEDARVAIEVPNVSIATTNPKHEIESKAARSQLRRLIVSAPHL